MQRKIISELPQLPNSKIFTSLKDAISKLIISVTSDKNLSSNTKQAYINILKQIDWGIGKVIPKWPNQVERMMEMFKSYISEFQTALAQGNNTGICGGSRATKNIQTSFRNIIGFKQVFPLIGHYQDKNIKQQLVSSIITLYQKYNPKQQKPKEIIKQIIREVPVERVKQVFVSIPQTKTKTSQKVAQQQIKINIPTKCEYCELYLSLSLQPNTYKVKQLLKTLPNTEWIYGIMYEQGKIFERNLQKSISYYEKAAAKKNADSIYRLGQLNQAGQYGQPYKYIQMWRKSAELGNLQAITDIGFLFQNGLQSQSGENILQPDYNKAQQYYLRAANQNFPRALNNLGSFYLQNQTFKNLQKSENYFNRAIEAGYIKAYFNLGICYNLGLLNVLNKQKAKLLFQRGAQLGDHQSKLFYVDLLLNSDSSKWNEQQLIQAHKYCRQMIAFQQDRAQPYYFQGIMYQNGLGIQNQPQTAFLYFYKAAKLQHENAIIKVADLYRSGTGIQKNFKQAIKYYSMVVQNRPQAFVGLGIIYEQGSQQIQRNFEKAFDYYMKGGNKGIGQAYLRIGNMYKLGRYVKRDEQKANEFIKKGEELLKYPNEKQNLNKSQSSLIQSSYYRSFQKGKK